jgi:hypothetical protein
MAMAKAGYSAKLAHAKKNNYYSRKEECGEPRFSAKLTPANKIDN